MKTLLSLSLCALSIPSSAWLVKCPTRILHPGKVLRSSTTADSQPDGPTIHEGTALDSILRIKGKVASGYGRGSRKLGFPTANLPSSLFGEALEAWPTGVYFGYAVVEKGQNGGGSGPPMGSESDEAPQTHATEGFGVCHKAVVNIGYSPTFEGNENPEKIVEAYIIGGGGGKAFDGDFYGSTMTLALIGTLRPECKFASFPQLVAQITQDVADAAAALDTEPFKSFPRSEVTEWGGSGAAEWDVTPFVASDAAAGGE